MLHAYVPRFDVTENLEIFFVFGRTKQGLRFSSGAAAAASTSRHHPATSPSYRTRVHQPPMKDEAPMPPVSVRPRHRSAQRLLRGHEDVLQPAFSGARRYLRRNPRSPSPSRPSPCPSQCSSLSHPALIDASTGAAVPFLAFLSRTRTLRAHVHLASGDVAFVFVLIVVGTVVSPLPSQPGAHRRRGLPRTYSHRGTGHGAVLYSSGTTGCPGAPRGPCSPAATSCHALPLGRGCR